LEFFFFLLTLMVAENNVHIIPDFWHSSVKRATNSQQWRT
jgi:hypothetical protein